MWIQISNQEDNVSRNQKSLWILLFSIAFFAFACLAFACVTINIYFPAEKVESVADEIVRDVRGQKETDKEKASPPKSDKNSSWIKTLFALAPETAWADEVTTVSNPAIRTLKDRLKSNFAQMKPYYQKGMVIEGANGYVSLGNIDSLGLKEKRDLKSFADAENQYRRQLYEEVAKALKIDLGQINRVAEIFAKEWQKPVR
jgi:uncharacterized protein